MHWGISALCISWEAAGVREPVAAVLVLRSRVGFLFSRQSSGTSLSCHHACHAETAWAGCGRLGALVSLDGAVAQGWMRLTRENSTKQSPKAVPEDRGTPSAANIPEASCRTQTITLRSLILCSPVAVLKSKPQGVPLDGCCTAQLCLPSVKPPPGAPEQGDLPGAGFWLQQKG